MFAPDLKQSVAVTIAVSWACQRDVWPHASSYPSHTCVLIVLPSLWLPLQTTSRRCRPAPCSRASSPSWASSCSWLSSLPSPKDRGSPSLASFSSSHVSIFFFFFWITFYLSAFPPIMSSPTSPSLQACAS